MPTAVAMPWWSSQITRTRLTAPTVLSSWAFACA